MMKKNDKLNFIKIKNISSEKHTLRNEKTYERLRENTFVVIHVYAVTSLKGVKEKKKS